MHFAGGWCSFATLREMDVRTPHTRNRSTTRENGSSGGAGWLLIRQNRRRGVSGLFP